MAHKRTGRVNVPWGIAPMSLTVVLHRGIEKNPGGGFERVIHKGDRYEIRWQAAPDNSMGEAWHTTLAWLVPVLLVEPEGA